MSAVQKHHVLKLETANNSHYNAAVNEKECAKFAMQPMLDCLHFGDSTMAEV